MNTAEQIVRKFPNLDGLEKKAALLKEMLYSYEQVSENLTKIEQSATDEEKDYILDLLGSKEEAKSAKDSIVISITSAKKLLEKSELNNMVDQGLLTKSDSQLINIIEKTNELNQLRSHSSPQEKNQERE